MKLTDPIELIGSGQMGFNLTDALDCHVSLIHDGDDAVIIDAGGGQGALHHVVSRHHRVATLDV